MAKKQATDTVERIKKTVRGASRKQAAIAGAGVLGAVALGAALFAGWRKGPAHQEPQVVDDQDTPVEGTQTADLDAAEDDAAKLHSLGTPMTIPVDGGVQQYTGDAEPDMVVDYLPEQDVGSTDTVDVQDR